VKEGTGYRATARSAPIPTARIPFSTDDRSL
jgi:hypothetical protein